MPGCCGTTEKQEQKAEQEKQKAEAKEKENAHTASCEVGQSCGQ